MQRSSILEPGEHNHVMAEWGVGFPGLRPTSLRVQNHPTICIFINFSSSAY
ncbi:hypothetical protein LINGRAHAP2_LOCUS17378 [Linum grandiflorum]